MFINSSPRSFVSIFSSLFTDCLESSFKVPNWRDFVPFVFLYPEATVMKSSQVLGDPEKRSSSSESGWTMYIGSQIPYDGEGVDNNNDDGGGDDDDVCFITDKEKHDKRNDNNNDDDDDDGNNDNDNDNDDDHESDDSMASDASSGPTLQELPCGNKEDLLRSHPFIVDQNKYSSGKKACKQLQKNKRDERKNTRAEKQQSVRKADSAASQV